MLIGCTSIQNGFGVKKYINFLKGKKKKKKMEERNKHKTPARYFHKRKYQIENKTKEKLRK